jgi:hypothetical protein
MVELALPLLSHPWEKSSAEQGSRSGNFAAFDPKCTLKFRKMQPPRRPVISAGA